MSARVPVVAALTFLFAAAAAFGDKIAWRETIEKAFEEAKAADKPVLVDAYAVG